MPLSNSSQLGLLKSFRSKLLSVLITFAFASSILPMEGQTRCFVVADSLSRAGLPNASVFDSRGRLVGTCDANGRIPYVTEADFPVTVRHLGFKERTVRAAVQDTVFLQESFMELPEVVFESRQHRVLHLLAYVREYSTLTTYADTVTLFREKMVDYMLPQDGNRFKGWSMPRVLKTRSYYRFTDSNGLDSVSDRSGHHFSWSDWVGVVPEIHLPAGLNEKECGIDTVRGKYGPAEIWTKNNDRLAVDIDVLADTLSRKWVPGLAGFFRENLDFENFKLRFRYGDVVSASLSPQDLTGYSFNVESKGRGREMIRFHRADEAFFVSTYAEVYVIDKEYITVKEARKWANCKFDPDEIDLYVSPEAPELAPSVKSLIARVENVKEDEVRLALVPDRRLGNGGPVNRHFGYRALQLLKTVTGIGQVMAKRKWNRQWKDFKRQQIHRTAGRDENEEKK